MKDSQRKISQGLKGIHLRLPVNVMKEIRKSAIDEDMSMQEFITEIYRFWKENNQVKNFNGEGP